MSERTDRGHSGGRTETRVGDCGARRGRRPPAPSPPPNGRVSGCWAGGRTWRAVMGHGVARRSTLLQAHFLCARERATGGDGMTKPRRGGPQLRSHRVAAVASGGSFGRPLPLPPLLSSGLCAGGRRHLPTQPPKRSRGGRATPGTAAAGTASRARDSARAGGRGGRRHGGDATTRQAPRRRPAGPAGTDGARRDHGRGVPWPPPAASDGAGHRLSLGHRRRRARPSHHRGQPPTAAAATVCGVRRDWGRRPSALPPRCHAAGVGGERQRRAPPAAVRDQTAAPPLPV